jgi:hypothetical protein
VTVFQVQHSQAGRNRVQCMRVKSMRSAGSRVSASPAAMNMVRFLVQARGRKSRPSWSTRVKMGRKATAITSSEKKTDGPTSSRASSRTRWKSPVPPWLCQRSSFL